MEQNLARDRGHVWYFDLLRLFALTCVILTHAASGPLRGARNLGWGVLAGMTSLAFTAVPLFFMMSGSLLLSGPKTLDLRVLFRKRLPKLLVPLACWTVVAALWLTCRERGSLAAAAKLALSGVSGPVYVHFWYLYTLAAMYVLSPLLYRLVHSLDRTGERYLLGMIGAVTLLEMVKALVPAAWLPYLSLDLAEELKLLQGHLFSFLLGYYLARFKRRVPNALLLGAAGLLLAVITLGTWWKTKQAGVYTAVFQRQSGGYELLLAACLFLLAKQNLDRPVALLRRLGVVELSMPIYLSHNLLLSLAGSLGLAPRNLGGVLAATAGILVVSWLLSKTLCTVPWVCYAVSGMPFSRARKTCSWLAMGKNSGQGSP